jgi:NAD(P)-dependent dehydrogenase (short-subunit alcohol dehydrogenase family)
MSSEARIALATKAAMGIGAAIAEQLARWMTVLVFRIEPARGGKDSAGS